MEFPQPSAHALGPGSDAPSALMAMEGCKSTFRSWRRFDGSICRSSCSSCRMTGMRQSVHLRSVGSAESSAQMAQVASPFRRSRNWHLPTTFLTFSSTGRRELEPQLKRVFSLDGPVLCEIPSPPDEPRQPVQVSEALPDGGMRSRAIEDLAPLLDRDELAENLRSDVLVARTDDPPARIPS